MRQLFATVFVATWLSSAQDLPRVLIIGDSISIGYTPFVEKQLAGKAVVQHNPSNAGTSGNGVFMMDNWLDDKQGKWNVIHFNFGLHDLKRMSDGGHQVEPEQYERYLRLFIARLRKTEAKLIYATTTPVPEGKVNPPRTPADVPVYNAIAMKILNESGIAVNDLYTPALAHAAEWQTPINVHYKPEGYEALAKQVTAAILLQLSRTE
jgi:lysophospholipase L1-like esterase